MQEGFKKTKILYVNLVNICDMGLKININVQDNLGR